MKILKSAQAVCGTLPGISIRRVMLRRRIIGQKQYMIRQWLKISQNIKPHIHDVLSTTSKINTKKTIRSKP
jgi:hypothetical protein